MRSLGLVLVVVGAGLLWLSVGDRQSALALSVVELDGKLPVPLGSLIGAAGVLLVGKDLLGRILGGGKDEPLPARQQQLRDGLAGQRNTGGRGDATPLRIDPGEDWKAVLRARARQEVYEPGVRIELDPAAGVPFALVLDSPSPEQLRRNVDQFAAFLSTIPTPPRVMVRFATGTEPIAPRKHLVAGVFRRYFPAGAQVVPQQDRLAIMLPDPDPRWR